MSLYNYVTILEAENDGVPPNDQVEEGDLHVKAGKHEDDSLSYIAEDKDMHTIQFEAIKTYELPHAMTEHEAMEYAADEYFEEESE